MGIQEYVGSSGWAMLPAEAERFETIALRAHETSPEVLEAYRAESLKNANRARTRDGVAILDVQGPLFKKANLFTRISGATSYEILRQDFQTALDDEHVHSIVLKIDSPGGEANGCDELAAAIYEARGKKPITAFVSGMAASGGYWIASAADTIVVSDAALLGSIGVVLGVRPRGPDDKTVEFVSSQSPGKRPDVGTDVGKSQIQTMVDDLAEVFVSAVAKYRGVTVEDVITKFGAGGIKVGAKAVASGMADEVGQLEAVISALSLGGPARFPRSIGVITMSTTTTGPTADEIAAQARTDAATRMKAIVTSDDGKVSPTLANFLAYDTQVPVADATKILAAAKADWPKASEVTTPTPQPTPPAVDPAAAYLEQQAAAGALGLGKPEATGATDKAAAGWASAVANANSSLGL